MIRIKDIMKHPVTTIIPSKSVYDAAHIMNKENRSALVVVDDDKPVGMLTARDIVMRTVALKMDTAAVKVGDIMSKPPITIDSRLFIEDMVRLTVKNKIKRLPVVEGGRLVGIITASDLTRYIGQLEASMLHLLW